MMVSDGRQVRYDPTADSLAAIAGGSDDLGKPLELFGVGFANEFNRLGVGTSVGDGAFDDTSPLWSAGRCSSRRSIFFRSATTDRYRHTRQRFQQPGRRGAFRAGCRRRSATRWMAKQPWDVTPWAVGTVAGLKLARSFPASRP